MQNVKNHLKAAFESFDIFGQPIQFSLNRKYLEKSSFGALMTIALIGIFVSIAFDGFFALIYHTNMTAYTQETNYRSPPSIDFKSRQFAFAITFNDIKLNDPRYFDLEVSQTIEITNKTGYKNRDKRKIQLEKCSSSHFSPEILDDLSKKSSNISNLLCPSKNLEIYVEGAYSSPKFAYFSIKLSKCKSNENKTCVTDEEVDAIFTEIGRVYLNIYFINNIINSNDFETPVVSFLDDRIYVLIDRNTYKEKNFFFEENKVFTDTSISTTSFQEDINTYTYENIYDETIVNHKGPADDVYAGIYFRSYLLGKQHMRKFEKIWDYMGQIGGFWSLLYLVFSIIAKKYNKFKLLMKIANSLYEFPELKSIPNFGNKTMRNLTLKINAKTRENDKDPFNLKMASYLYKRVENT